MVTRLEMVTNWIKNKCSTTKTKVKVNVQRKGICKTMYQQKNEKKYEIWKS